MAKQPRDLCGIPTALWTTKEDAKKYRAAKYISDDDCADCLARGFNGALIRVRYTNNDRCAHCSTMESMELQELATYRACIGRNEDGQALYVITRDNSERPVSDEYVEYMDETLDRFDGPAPTTRSGARDMGYDVYIRGVPCSKAGHIGLMTLKGECFHCLHSKPVKSARQAALSNGAKWYTPETPCKHCNTTSERRVDNGQCRGCAPEKKTQSGTKELMDNNPDMVISREDARTYGFTVYRTGDACRRGHKGYRYVSTGNCLECIGL